MPSAGADLVRSKVRIGTERPTAELTPARSIRIVEKVTQGNSGIPIFSGAPPSHPSVQSHRP